MQAGRPYQDRLFPCGQFNCAIAGCSHSRQFYRAHINSPYLRAKNSESPVPFLSIESCDRSLIPSKRQFCSLPKATGRVRKGLNQGIGIVD